MSTQVLENEAAKVTELGAETVESVLSSPQSVSATRTYSFTIELYEKFGRAHIAWKLDPNYAVGAEDAVQLREGGTIKYNRGVSGTVGEYDTKHPWGSGLNASYWGLNAKVGSNPWRQLVVTPDT